MPSVCKNKVIVGSLRHTPVLGAYHVSNVTITGSGTIDGQGQPWWENCTKCHYAPGNDPRFCVNATRPKLIETQFVTGFRVLGAAAVALPESSSPPSGMQRCRITTAAFELKKSNPVPGVHGAYDAYTVAGQGPTKHLGEYCGRKGSASGHAVLAFASDNATLAQCSAKCTELGCTCYDYLLPTPPPPPFDWSRTLTLQNSPFWTLTPSYSQQIHVRDLRILAPMDRIGNTDGVNIDSSRDVLVENVYIKNSDDGVCIKSGLDGFGLNLAIPTENVLVRNITCAPGGRGGFAIGSEMSGGLRNITFRDSALQGQRGIDLKPSVGRGGYIDDLSFINILGKGAFLNIGHDGQPLMQGNNYVPLISNLRFENVSSCSFGGCSAANRSKCFNITVVGGGSHCHTPAGATDPLPPQQFGCKRSAHTLFGDVEFPWGVCIPLDAPVNIRPDYPNWGPITGPFASLAACKAACA
jgi:hypothetical protein